jgi:protease I
MDLLNKNKKRKVLFVIAHEDFRDEEYFIAREALEELGVDVVTASSDLSPATGVKGGEAKIDVLLSDVVLDDYDAIAIAGGRGARLYFEMTDLHDLIRNFNKEGKVVAAICAAPVILAKAGVLSGKKATAWHTSENMEYPEEIKMFGALFVDEDVVIDGKVVTANNPESSRKFGETIASLIG